ncbi:hypothetical protein C7M84_008873 [Penaeus vannamei]|uniref:Uncharacterized protein n=1 Tax=Penaeus vannamei TaxID=6689 RepID=A0A423T8I1_PENVA|nr:hypothetical protein C7M84_008873 [Penaeus vannamei]
MQNPLRHHTRPPYFPPRPRSIRHHTERSHHTKSPAPPYSTASLLRPRTMTPYSALTPCKIPCATILIRHHTERSHHKIPAPPYSTASLLRPRTIHHTARSHHAKPCATITIRHHTERSHHAKSPAPPYSAASLPRPRTIRHHTERSRPCATILNCLSPRTIRHHTGATPCKIPGATILGCLTPPSAHHKTPYSALTPCKIPCATILGCLPPPRTTPYSALTPYEIPCATILGTIRHHTARSHHAKSPAPPYSAASLPPPSAEAAPSESRAEFARGRSASIAKSRLCVISARVSTFRSPGQPVCGYTVGRLSLPLTGGEKDLVSFSNCYELVVMSGKNSPSSFCLSAPFPLLRSFTFPFPSSFFLGSGGDKRASSGTFPFLETGIYSVLSFSLVPPFVAWRRQYRPFVLLEF